MKVIKINWQKEKLHLWYKKMGYPEKVWKDNQGYKYGIRIFENGDKEDMWFNTEKSQDLHYNHYLEDK
tara:strand:+ start:312 stop:515 length:204 start_codon:yes stop_codon:yes gene_type:complete